MSDSNDHLHDGTPHPRRRLHRIPTLLGPRRRSRAPLSPRDERYLQRIHDVRHLLNGEWYWDVLVALHDQPRRYTELLNVIRARTPPNRWPGKAHRRLQDGAFSRTLRRLMESELVERDCEPCFPFAVTYRLTPTARELLAVMGPAVEWAEANKDLLIRVQKRRHKCSDG